MKSSVVENLPIGENAKSNSLKTLSKLFSEIFLPIAFAVLILFTSGYAKTTTRQGSFNSSVLIVLAVFMVVMLIITILKTPTEFYKYIIHPIKNNIFKKSTFYFIAIPIVCFAGFLLFYYLKGNEISTLGHYVALIVFAFSFAMIIPFKTFVKYYNKTVLFLSLFSASVFIIMLFAGRTQFFSSTFISKNEAYYRSFLGLYFRIDVGAPRNYGPFWEPGIFSLIILIAIIFELMTCKKIPFANLSIYFAAILTTFSTSALLLFPFCFPFYFAIRKNKKWFYITLVIAIVIVATVILLGNPNIHIPFFSDVFSKLFSNSDDGSFKTRLLSPIYCIYLAGKSYGLGLGPNVFDARYEVLLLFGNTNPLRQTSTVGWLMGAFGLVGLLFVISSFIFLFYWFKDKYNYKVAIFATIFAFIAINCEPMYAFSIFWILFMYPFVYEIKYFFASSHYETSLMSTIGASRTSTKLTISNLSWSLIIKVAALLIGLLLYPLYIKYFGNQTSFVTALGDKTTYGAITLGTWLVILQILSWVLTFDMGIGNGLKNKIVEAINTNRRSDVKKIVSASYISNLAIIVVLLAIGLPVIFSINFNSLLNVAEEVVPIRTLQLAIALAFISICLEFFLKIVLNIYQALQKQAIASLIPLLSTILLLIFVRFCRIESMSNALVAISIFYIFSVNAPLIVSTIILFSTEFKDCKPSFKEWSFPIAKSVVTLGGVYFAIQLFLLLINSTNKVIISNTYGAEVVSNYEPYLKIFSAICAVASAVSLPIWTLVLRADSLKDYQWISKMQKNTFKIMGLFAIGSLAAAGLLQIVFNFWLGSESFAISYFKAFMFAIWAIASICSYFVSAFSNGLKILKPQIIVLGCCSIVKVPLFFLIRYLVPSIDWVVLIIIDAAIMTIYSITLVFFNHKAINQRFLENVQNDQSK